MKLHLATNSDKKQFTGYGNGYVEVNNQRYTNSVAITPDGVHDKWQITAFEDLNTAHFAFLLSLKPEIVILGTGATQRFPHPALLRNFTQAQVGIEVMATPAACRTFNILMAEGRAVVAAVLVT